MELICLIKCLTELAFGVQRDFKHEGRDEICSEEEEKLTDCTIEDNRVAKTTRGREMIEGTVTALGFTQASH